MSAGGTSDNRWTVVHFGKWLDEAGPDLLRQSGNVVLQELDPGTPYDVGLSVLRRAHVFHNPKPPFKVDARLLAECPHMVVCSTEGVGYDKIDVNACSARSVLAVNQAGTNTQAVAEHVVGMMLAHCHSIACADRALRSKASIDGIDIGFDLFGRTVGIVGLGAIGRRVASICSAGFSMQVLAYKRGAAGSNGSDQNMRFVELTELLSASDFVSVHVPLSQETRDLISASELRMMKEDAFLVSTSRGGVVNEKALLDALLSGRLGGAGLDVWEAEPPLHDNPLLKLDNVIATPHIAGATREARRAASISAARQIRDVLSGRLALHALNPDCWPAVWARIRDIQR